MAEAKTGGIGRHGKKYADALKKIEEGDRSIPRKMRKKLEELSPEHRKALLDYYASFK